MIYIIMLYYNYFKKKRKYFLTENQKRTGFKFRFIDLFFFLRMSKIREKRFNSTIIHRYFFLLFLFIKLVIRFFLFIR